MFTNLFHKPATSQSVPESKTKSVWNPLIQTMVSVDETLVPLVTALWAQKYDVVHCSRDDRTGEVVLGFATNTSASQFISIVAFFHPESSKGSLVVGNTVLDDILQGTGGWKCETLVRFVALERGYEERPAVAPIYINILVRFPGQRLDYVLKAIEASKGGKGVYQ